MTNVDEGSVFDLRKNKIGFGGNLKWIWSGFGVNSSIVNAEHAKERPICQTSTQININNPINIYSHIRFYQKMNSNRTQNNTLMHSMV